MSPYESLNEEQKQKILNSSIIIDNAIVRIIDVDEIENALVTEEVLNSLTQQQIDAILSGQIIDLNDKFPSIAGSSQKKNQDIDEHATGLLQSRPVRGIVNDKYNDPRSDLHNEPIFQLLNENEKEKIRNSLVQVPGLNTILLRELVNNDETAYNCLSREEIDKMLKNELVVFFEQRQKALDHFLATKGAVECADPNEPRNGRGFIYQPSSSSSNSLSSGNNSSNENTNNEGNQRGDDNNSNLYFEGMNPFLEKINENRTIIVLKPSEFDESLYYVYMYLRQKYSRTARMITFYFNFNDFAYSKLFEEMHSQTESDFLDQLFKLTGAESEFERFLFERNYKSGGIFWIMDNVEYLQAGPTLNQEIILSVLLKFIKEIRFNSLGLQIEKNWQFVVSNLANVMNRVDELQSPVYSVEKREGPVDYDMMIAMREIGSNRNIIISIKKFPI